MTGAFVILVIGEALTRRSSLPDARSEWVGILLLALACAGLIAAFKWEWQGGLLSVAALGLFTAMVALNADIVLWLAAIPGLLFVADWFARRRSHA
jgi:hypothetical protein